MVRQHVVWTVLLTLLLSPLMESSLRAAEPTREELQRQLTAKLAELEALKQEVEALQSKVAPQQLLIHLKTFEVNLTKLTDLGIDFDSVAIPKLSDEFMEGSPGGLQAMNAGQAKAFGGFLEALISKNVARLVSDPALVTVVGRSAEFHQGAEIPNGVDANGKPVFEKIGAAASVSGELAGPNRVKLDLKLRNSRLRHEPKPGEPLPIEVDEIQTAVALNSGETLMLPGAQRQVNVVSVDSQAGTRKEVSYKLKTLYLVSVELIEPMADFQTALPPGSESFSSLPTPVRYAATPAEMVVIEMEIAELSLTKLRNLGIDAKEPAQLQAALGLIDAKSVTDQTSGAAKFQPWSIENVQRFDESLKSLREKGALEVISRPRATTLFDQMATVMVGAQPVLQAVPVAYSRTPGDSPIVFPPMPQRSVEAFTMEIVPRRHENGVLKLELTASHSDANPAAQATSHQGAEAATFVVSKTTETMEILPGRRMLIPGEAFQRSVSVADDGRSGDTVEEVLPLYVVKANVISPQPSVPRPVPPTVDSRPSNRVSR